MQGMHRVTGQSLSGIEHLRQSIGDILTTPLGSRVMRRDYGCRLFQWLDAPINRGILVEIYAAVAEALLKWEPRFVLKRIQVEQVQVGQMSLNLEGIYRSAKINLHLENILV